MAVGVELRYISSFPCTGRANSASSLELEFSRTATSTKESRSGLLGSSSPADDVSDEPPRYIDGRLGTGGIGAGWLDVEEMDEMEPLDPKKLPSFFDRRGGDDAD